MTNFVTQSHGGVSLRPTARLPARAEGKRNEGAWPPAGEEYLATVGRLNEVRRTAESTVLARAAAGDPKLKLAGRTGVGAAIGQAPAGSQVADLSCNSGLHRGRTQPNATVHVAVAVLRLALAPAFDAPVEGVRGGGRLLMSGRSVVRPSLRSSTVCGTPTARAGRSAPILRPARLQVRIGATRRGNVAGPQSSDATKVSGRHSR